MTDQDLVAKKLAFIETCLCDLRQLARPDRLSTDVREIRFVEHTLQMAIQAALDVASHIVSDNRLGEPRTNRELFDLLGRHGWLAPALVGVLQNPKGRQVAVVGQGGACRGDGPPDEREGCGRARRRRGARAPPW